MYLRYLRALVTAVPMAIGMVKAKLAPVSCSVVSMNANEGGLGCCGLVRFERLTSMLVVAFSSKLLLVYDELPS
jgi:hypothetical protein